MVVFYKNDRTDVGKLTQEDNPEEEEEDEAREWVPKVGRKNPSVSSPAVKDVSVLFPNIHENE